MCAPKTRINLRIRVFWAVCIVHEETAFLAIQNAPSECAGWSESSLGAQFRRYVFWSCSWYVEGTYSVHPDQTAHSKGRLRRMQATKALIRLRIRAVWSGVWTGPSLSAYRIIEYFSMQCSKVSDLCLRRSPIKQRPQWPDVQTSLSPSIHIYIRVFFSRRAQVIIISKTTEIVLTLRIPKTKLQDYKLVIRIFYSWRLFIALHAG